MARQINRLTARRLPSDPGLHADGDGLYLSVKPSGSSSWVMIYNREKKRRELGLGSTKVVTLAEARAKVRQHRQAIQQGVDPLRAASSETFGSVAEALIDSLRPSWKSDKHADQWTNTLKTHAATVWKMPVSSIETTHVEQILNPIWVSIPETASRVRSRMERVLDAAKVRGLRTGDNPARWKGHLEVILPKRKLQARSHHPAMPYNEVPSFVQRLSCSTATSARALEFLILTAARTSEVMRATWSEFDLEASLWTVPASRMKAGVIHRVPLAPRALAILVHMKFLGGDGPFSMSNMAMDMLLRRMDCDDYTVHGFRSSFRDWVGEETDFPREIAEAALAHQVGSAVERAYRRGDALEKRRTLMLAWADYVTRSSTNC